MNGVLSLSKFLAATLSAIVRILPSVFVVGLMLIVANGVLRMFGVKSILSIFDGPLQEDVHYAFTVNAPEDILELELARMYISFPVRHESYDPDFLMYSYESALVAAGCDMQGIEILNPDVSTPPETLRISIPEPEVIYVSVDRSRTRTRVEKSDYSLADECGVIFEYERDLIEEFKAQAIERNIIELARERAEQSLSDFYGAIGCSIVEIEWH